MHFILKLLLTLVALNLAYTTFLYSWVTDDDIPNLPKHPAQRFMTLFYFTITTSTGTGYGDFTAKSTRARMCMSAFMLTFFVVVFCSQFFIAKMQA